jgi:hypothetical protein
VAEYAIGAVVDDYALTADGWVPLIELDPSPFRPGDVVNGHLLSGDLTWLPLRTNPTQPYRVGDVVADHVLVPAGEWRPLTSVTRTQGADRRRRDRAAGPQVRVVPAPAATGMAQASTHQVSSQAPAQGRAAAVSLAQGSTHQVSSQPAARTATAGMAPAGTRQASSQRPTAPARRRQAAAPQYRLGDTANGYVLTAAGWVPQTSAAGRAAPAAGRPGAPGARPGQNQRGPATAPPMASTAVHQRTVAARTGSGPHRLTPAGGRAGSTVTAAAVRFLVFGAFAVIVLLRACS